MKTRKNPRQLRLIASAVVALFSSAAPAASVVETPTVEVVGSTPLPGIGVDRRHLPVTVHTLDAAEFDGRTGPSPADALLGRLPSVNLNEVQGNPLQADLNYRGFTASPLLGTPQGLSVYVDGVRANEPFGDTVNWELLPKRALAGVDLLPGSNPLFGLNTLGGALVMRTRSGFSHPGGSIDLSGGSFGRSETGFDYGVNNGRIGAYVAGNWFREDGWRDYSPSDVKQLFGKLSLRDARYEADLSLAHTRGRLIGNGVVPQSLYEQRREAIFTRPDETRNESTQVALSGRYWLSDESSLSGSVYHRRTVTRTLNGDMNDDYEDDPTEGSGALNRTRTRQQTSGLAMQWNLSGKRHQLAVGGSFDHARVHFGQTQQMGEVNGTRGIGDLDDEVEQENLLRGTTQTASLFVTDTVALTDTLHLTASARYQWSHVTTFDILDRTAPNLDGDHQYRKLNPALGLAWQALPGLDVYAGFSQGTRIPTPIELGCADPANPCTLPNSMAADPYLKQVVSRTLEAGLRGRVGEQLRWNAGVYRTLNQDDILFVGTSTSAGYFTNFGKTERQGLELGIAVSTGRVDWRADYNWLRATYRSDACILAENNSTRGTAPECTAGGQDDEILVRRGDRLPGLPEHMLKLGVNWRATDRVRIGADLLAFSSQYARGNENNRHRAGTATDALGETREFAGGGKIPGYAVVNLNGDIDLGAGWQLFGRISNLFDRRYASAGVLAENPFTGAGNAFAGNADDWRRETFVAPGAPRAAWIGVRYRFGGR